MTPARALRALAALRFVVILLAPILASILYGLAFGEVSL